MVIDAHHHFWNYDPVEFDWIDDDMRAIRRNFLPEELKREIRSAGIDGVVSVQARQTLEETDWLLEQARTHDFIRGVVGWLPIASAEFEAPLERLADQPKLKALRHVVQGEAPGFLDQPAFNAGIGKLRHRGLVYDLLVFENQLEEAIRFVDRHPNQVFVLDHLAKPRIKDGQIDPWQGRLREFARRAHVSCKLSGMVTEADFQTWTPEQLQPYLDTALTAFGPTRLMFGSDWPVCLVAAGYKQWADLVRNFIAPLSSDERSAILGGTATRAYHL